MLRNREPLEQRRAVAEDVPHDFTELLVRFGDVDLGGDQQVEEVVQVEETGGRVIGVELVQLDQAGRVEDDLVDEVDQVAAG